MAITSGPSGSMGREAVVEGLHLDRVGGGVAHGSRLRVIAFEKAWISMLQ